MPVLSSPILPLLRLLVLPLRAPLLLLLVAVAAYIGGTSPAPLWSFDALHVVAIVVVCSMPLRLLRGITGLMAVSQVATLVLTLLIVTLTALYLLNFAALSRVLILGSAVLLARVDLARVRVVPPPLTLAASLSVLVLLSCVAGRWLVSRWGG